MQPLGLVSPGAAQARATRAAAAVGPAKEHDWENAKENFKPLPGGRTAASLKDKPVPLGMDTGLDAAAREAQAAFETELSTYTGSDPLSVWTRYVKWAADAGRTGGGGLTTGLLPLLERATRELQKAVAAGKHATYPADPRYLRLWLQYADALPGHEAARDVFAFMAARGIGTQASLFWAARAARAELARDWDGAAAAYAEGEAVGAVPADRLAARRAEFEARMARRVARDLADGGGGGGSAQPSAPSRAALGSLRAPPARPRPAAPNGARPAVGGTRAAGPRRAPAARQGGGGGPGLAVFVDGEFGGEPAAGAGAPPPSAHTAGDGWDALPSHADTRKENEPAAARWAGTTLPRAAGGGGGSRRRAGAAAAPAPPAAPVEVFVDEECAGPAPDPVAATRAALAAEATGGARPGRARLEKAGGGRGAANLARLVADPVAGHRAAEAEAAAAAAAAAEDPAPTDDAADVTLATRDALAAVGGLFCGALPGDAPWGGGGDGDDAPPAPQPTADVTATLGTRDALAALAAAFGGGAGGPGPAEEPGPPPAPPTDDDGLIVPYEDTLFRLPGAPDGLATATLTRPVGAQPARPEDEHADQENAAPPGGGGGGAACPRPAAAKARGLRVASPGRAGVVADPDAEAALVAGGGEEGDAVGGDGFVVAAD